MQDLSPWVTLVVGVLSSGGLVAALGFWFNRKKTAAETTLTDSQTGKTEAETTLIIEQAAGELIDDLRDYQKQILKEYTETKEQNKLLAQQVDELNDKVSSIPALEAAVRELTEGVHTLTQQLLEAGISPAFKAPKF